MQLKRKKSPIKIGRIIQAFIVYFIVCAVVFCVPYLLSGLSPDYDWPSLPFILIAALGLLVISVFTQTMPSARLETLSIQASDSQLEEVKTMITGYLKSQKYEGQADMFSRNLWYRYGSRWFGIPEDKVSIDEIPTHTAIELTALQETIEGIYSKLKWRFKEDIER